MMKQSLLIALVLVLAAAGPALALSCRAPSPEQAFLDAAGSVDTYIVVHGQLEFNPGQLPGSGGVDAAGNPPAGTSFPASFNGFSLTEQGFTARFVRTVQVVVSCAGPWCGSLVSGADYLAFLKVDDGGYKLEASPCPSLVFVNPPDEDVQKVVTCFQGGPCDPPLR